MNEEIETTIYTEDQSRVSLSEWDNGGAWLKIGVRGGGAYTTLTRDEVQQLFTGLKAILDLPVAEQSPQS